MALTNAEKQKRYRERIKAKLAQSGGDSMSEAAEVFRRECQEICEQVKAEGAENDFDLNDLLRLMIEGDPQLAGLQGSFLAHVMGLPADPWPGLTHRDLFEMTKGRTREARRLDIELKGDIAVELGFLQKLQVSRHRDWLEQGRT